MFALFAAALTLPMFVARPNIVLIVGDDVGYGELQCYNPLSITPTPHLDGLAKSGIRLTSAHVTHPICGPSRLSLMTGKDASRYGQEMSGGKGFFGTPEDEKMLSEYLHEAGYTTMSVGKWHLGWQPYNRPRVRGFDEFFGFGSGGSGYYDTHPKRAANPIFRNETKIDEKDYLTYAFRREAVNFIDTHARDRNPFFLYLPFSAIHTPFEAPPEMLAKFSNVTDRKRKYLSAMLAAHDKAVGDVLEALRTQGIRNDTLVIYIGDNGGEWAPHVDNRPLRGSKFRIWEGGIRVPMMVSWPGKNWSDGHVYDGLVSSLDLMPTILGVADIAVPSGLDGIDILPALESGLASAPHPPLFFRYGPEWAVISDHWKRLHEKDPVTLEEHDWLFDLSRDIGETRNVIKANPAIKVQLEKLYHTWKAHLPPPRWMAWPRPDREDD